MIPVQLIPLFVRIGTMLVDRAFKALDTVPPDKKSEVLDKIEKNDKKHMDKIVQGDDDHDW